MLLINSKYKQLLTLSVPIRIIILLLSKSLPSRALLKDVSKLEIEREIATIKTLSEEWANIISSELGGLSELSRRDKVAESFADYTIYEEDWGAVVEELAKNIRSMMADKIKAVKAIKRHAEMLSLHRKEDINAASSYNYYNANNLTQTSGVEDRVIDRDEAERIWKCSIPTNVSDLCFDNRYRSDDSFAYQANEFKKFEYRETSQLYSKLGRCEKMAFLYRPEQYYHSMNLHYHPQFDANVNMNYSIVRVTPNVFDRGDQVLNEIRWSEGLDLTFKCNFKRDPTLFYQYFASPTGFMRFYPAMKWSEEEYDDTFDFRIRSWYIEAMSSAKDIVILLDRSGSMKGYRRAMATQIVNSILDTLTDNDYVNIYTFSNTTESLVDCFNDTLVQANEENLRLLREQLTDIQDQFAGDISLGLEKAFPILLNHRKVRRGIACNQAIMLITEGLDYEYKDFLFKMYNHDPLDKYYRPVRIFTYLIGTEPMEAQRMKWIACANMGYFVNVTVIEEVREKVLKYLEVLSRPINMSPHIAPEPAWTTLYVHLADRRLSNWLWKKNEGNRQRTIFINYEKQEMDRRNLTVLPKTTHFTQNTDHPYKKYQEFPDYKYLTSVSLPVFDLRPNETGLLGVAAVDVELDYIKQLAEPHRIGVNGYSFTLTNNGYVLHHPDHRTEFRDHILKPTFNRVDLTEVEISDNTNIARQFDEKIIKLREDIVLHGKGKRKLKVRAPIDDMKRVLVGSRHYFYTEINPFSLVIALPDKYGAFVMRRNATVREMIEIRNRVKRNLKRKKRWRVNPKWLYTCNTTRASKSAEEELLHFLNVEGTELRCNQDLMTTMLKDANVTEWFDDDDRIFRNIGDKAIYHAGVVLTFMATHTGLTRWKNLHPKVSEDHQHFANKHNRASEEIYYRRAAELNYNDPNMYIYSVPFDVYNASSTLITASNVIFHKKDKRRAPIAAVGYQILHQSLNHILQTLKCPREMNCKSTWHAWVHYVVDNDGYIILANNTQVVGKSLADVDIALMQTMVKDGVFKEITVFDYQGTCFPDYTSSEPFYGPSAEDVKDKHMKCSTPIKCKTIEFLRKQLKKTTPTPCDIELKMYNYQFNRFSHVHPDQNDRDCPCPYISEPISGTNLVLIILTEPCCDKESGVPVNQFPKEIAYNLTLPCHIAVNNNFTKRHYTKCITQNKNEYLLNTDNSYCGGEGIVPLE